MAQTTTTKRCNGCETTKDFSEFPKNKLLKDGHGGKCYPCQREAGRESYQKNREHRRKRTNELRSNPEVRLRLAWKSREAYAEYQRYRKKSKEYGLSVEDAKVLLNGVCAICGAKPDPSHKGTAQRSLNIDHDHTTGMVRGALCHSCNGGLGRFKDNPALLRKAAEYLEDHVFGPKT